MGYWTGNTTTTRRPADDAVAISVDTDTLAMWVGPPAAYYYKTYLDGQASDITAPNYYGGFRWFPDVDYATSYDWYVEAYAEDGETVIATSPTWTFTTEDDLRPGKPTNPSPTDAATDITLDQTPLEWADGGNTDTYEIYFRASGDDWTLVGVSQAGITWTIPFGSIDYDITYEWRVDATNVYGTTTGDTWSFGAITFDCIRTSYVLITGGSGAGPYDDPPGVEGIDWSYTGLNFITALRKLVGIANSKVWFEDI